MPFLEIIHLTGGSERHELSKQSPVSIGSHSSNDIVIDEESVEIMHCRISWTKQGFEAVAAGIEPLDLNGTPIQKTVLKSGDTLRFGSVDIRYRTSEEDDAEAPAAGNQGELGLKPMEEARPGASNKKKSKPAPPPEDDILDDGDFLDDDEFEELEELDELEEVEEPAPSKKQKSSKSKAKPQAEEPAPKTEENISDGMSDRVREAMRHRRSVRPGEEDPLRSPLVLGLLGTAAALLLTGSILYFIANRQTINDQYDAAKAAYDEGNFLAADELFEKFIITHPKHDLAKEAKIYKGLGAIRSKSEGAAPQFPEALSKLRNFITDQRDLEEFEQLHPNLMEQGEKISLGAAVAAGRKLDPELLDISREARTILKTYAPKDTPPTETLNLIESELRKSTALILKNDVYQEHIASMTKALEDKKPLEVLKTRRDLLVRYPEFERDKKVVELMTSARKAEKESVTFSDVNQDAKTEAPESLDDRLTMVFQGRTRTDEVSVGKSVICLGKDCVYGIDFVTAEPVWRYVIGFDTPFFPLIESETPSIVVFETNHNELVRLNQDTGALLWRQPVGERVTGQPILSEDQILAATESGRLIAVDMETGQLKSQLQFNQTITGPVELKDGEHLVVAGYEEVIYTLTKRPLGCEQVSYIGQQPGSVEAPLIAMGPYLLLIENHKNSASLHLIQAEQADQPLSVTATEDVEGRVVDEPVIRGRDLFVPSTGERVSAFSISDDAGQPPLTVGPSYQGEGEHPGSIYLLPGPDRQLWMSTANVAKFQLTTDTLGPDSDPIATGIAAQPLQYYSGYILHARRPLYSDAVSFTRTDRDDLDSDWQAVVGSRPLAYTVRPGSDTPSIAVVNESGQTFRIGSRQLDDGKFLTEAAARLPLHQDLDSPLMANGVTGERIAVVCGGPEPRMWVVNAAGQIEGSPQLPSVPQAAPASIGKLIVVPLEGRLHVPRLSGQQPMQDLALPTGSDSKWVSLVTAAQDSAVAVTDKGQVLLVQLQPTPRPHLDASTNTDLKAPVDVPAASNGQHVAVADRNKRLTVFTADRLDKTGERTFSSNISAPPVFVGGKLLVAEGQKTLHAISAMDQLESQWTLPLNGTTIMGAGTFNNTTIVALQNGDVLIVNLDTGEVLNNLSTQSPLTLGPFETAGNVFVGSIDGTLFRLNSLLEKAGP